VNAGCSPHMGSLGSCAELDYECWPQLLAFPEGGGISWSNARRKLGGANGGRCRAELSRDIAASRTRIGTTQPARAGRTGGGASDAFFWQTASWWLSARISACRAALVRNWRLLKRKGDEKRAHRGSHHDLTNGRNPCVFRSDEVFGKHSFTFDGFRASSRQTLPWDYFRVARDTTKCVSAAQQRVARRRSQLTTANTVADTAICACRMQRHVAEGQCPPTISSWRPICPI
jgi:hypothetical protein